MEVRPVRPDEYEMTGRATAEAFGEYGWDDYLEEIADVAARVDRGDVVLVAAEDGRILGSVTAQPPGAHPDDPWRAEAMHIRMLGVSPAARGRGAGRALMAAAVGLARERGWPAVTLRTTDRMPVARGMYERTGFRRVPDADKRSDDDSLLVAYRLDL